MMILKSETSDLSGATRHAAGNERSRAYALARDRAEPLLYKGTDFSHTDIRSAIG